MGMLEDIVGPDAELFLEAIQSPAVWPGVKDLDRTLDDWASRGAHLAILGRSTEGTPIRAAEISLGQEPTRTLLAWGYPHPDEPVGAAALEALGEAALSGKLAFLKDWKLVLLLCADPDQVARQTWLGGSGSMSDWAGGVWRPTHLGLEVDYGFPIDYPPFYQPPSYDGACHTAAECALRHGGYPCPQAERPFAPLKESLALREALRRYRPELIASMHSTHTGGDYTFLLHRESPEVLEDLVRIPAASGSIRYLGEAIDRGHRWRADAPDLIREYTLENHTRHLQRMPSYQEGMLYAGNASAASVIEAELPGVQFICPETALFRAPEFADVRPATKKLQLRRGTMQRRKGLYEVLLFSQGSEWIVGQQERARKTKPIRQESAWAPRSVLGARALVRRRKALGSADKVWRSLQSLKRRPHLYEEERSRITVPGEYVGDGSMLIFRSREDYRRRATRAQAASFLWLWPAHTASLLGNFSSWLRSQDQDNPQIKEASQKIRALQESEIRRLPESLQQEADRSAGMRSQLARIIRLMNERSK